MQGRTAYTVELQSLLDQAADGQDGAYDELISRASARLLKLTRKMFRAYPHLRRWEQTDDVLQQAALRLYRSLKDVQPGSVREFLGLAALQIRRTLIDLARHHFGPEGAAAHHHSTAGNAATAATNKVVASSEPESLAGWTRFHEVVDVLPEEEREVFALTWYSGMSQVEIARLLDVSVPTVRRRWQRAKVLVFEQMQGQLPQTREH